MLNVCVIGLGEIGIPTALYDMSQGLNVIGLDISEESIEKAREKGIVATATWNDIKDINVYQVCVTTKYDGRANADAVFNVCDKIARRLKSDELIAIESTIPIGTTRSLHRGVFNNQSNISLVHCPQRYWKEDPMQRGVRRHRLIGGINDLSLDKGRFFYSNILNMDLRTVQLEVAEFSKVFENAYRFIQIAVAEELAMICDKNGLDFDEVRHAVMSASDMHYLPRAKSGIGGHCLPMAANWMEMLDNNTIIRAALDVDVQYRRWLYNKKVIKSGLD